MRNLLLFTFVFMVLILAACGGNKLDIDIDRTQEAVAERAMKDNSVKEGDYESENITLVRVCEASEIGEEDFGFNGEYLVYWETDDKEHNGTVTMEEYEAGLGSQRYEPIEDRCIEID